MTTNAFLADGSLDQSRLDAEAMRALGEAARHAMSAEARSLRIKTGHLLLALIARATTDEALSRALQAGMCEGLALQRLPVLLTSYLSDTKTEQAFQLAREDFSTGVRRAIEHCYQVENSLGDVVWTSGGRPVPLLPFCHALLVHADAEDVEKCDGLFSFEKAAEALLDAITPPPPPDERPFADDGALRPEHFAADAVESLRAACERTDDGTAGQAGPLQVFAAMIDKTDGAVEKVLRSQFRFDIGMPNVREALRAVLPQRKGGGAKAGAPTRERFSSSMHRILQTTVQTGAGRIGDAALLAAMLREEREGVLGRCLSGGALRLNLTELERAARTGGPEIDEDTDGELEIATHYVKLADLTWQAVQGGIDESVNQDILIERMERALSKMQNASVLITGEPGVGKSTLVRELARRIADGSSRLKGRKLLLGDADAVAADQSRDAFAELAAALQSRKTVILCVDHFQNLLRHKDHVEGHNRDIIGAALRTGALQLIGILEDRHFTDQVGADTAFTGCFTVISVPEPDVDQTIYVLERRERAALEARYGVTIPSAVAVRAVRVADQFILSERLPAKAIKVLSAACERAVFDAHSSKAETETIQVTLDDLFKAAAEITKLDVETISASGMNVDFEAVLGRSVVGQDEAVRDVAGHLKMLKAGLADKGKPAGVFFFAGLTGVGKTELAQSLAEIYSATRSLQRFALENFTSDHSLWELTGCPPGIKGHDKGGSIVNALNADPFSVMLFDEADKAHPSVLQALLTLLDKGWIEDTRGVRAYGNKAIFVFASNAGSRFISENYQTLPPDVLKTSVRQLLAETRNSSGQRPFSAEFFGRFPNVIIFNPLSAEAFGRIAVIKIKAFEKRFQLDRGKTIEVAQDVLVRIGRQSFEDNEEASGALGARRVEYYLMQWIKTPLTDLQMADPEAFRSAGTIRVRSKDGRMIAEIVE